MYVETPPWKKNGKAGLYRPGSQDGYVELVARALTLLPSGVVIHRLTGDPAPGRTDRPGLGFAKGATIRKLDALLDSRDWWQGKQADAPNRNPWEKKTTG